MESGKKQREVNIWFVATILLAAALVIVLVLRKDSNMLIGPDGKESRALQPKEASTKLISFLTEVSNSPDKAITLNDIVEESGLYKLNVTYPFKDPNTGKTGDETADLYLTRDAKIFIPKIVNLDDAIAKYEEFKQNQGQNPSGAPTSTNNTSTPSSQE